MSFSSREKTGERLGAALLAACLFAPIPAFGQNRGGDLQISGTVAALNGAPLVGAQVVLHSYSSGAELKRTTTVQEGRYAFRGLSLGAYKVSAGASGFETTESKLIILTSSNATADLTLTLLTRGREGAPARGAPKAASPAFAAAGIQGTLAPSGYSTGLSDEEAAQVRTTANAVQPNLLNMLPEVAEAECSQEPALRRAIEKTPRDFAANHALGVLYLSQADYAKAIQFLGAARSLVPQDFTNTRDLAAALIAGGRGTEAAALLQQMVPDHKTDSTLLRLLAYAFRSAGAKEKAVAAFQKAAGMDAGVENQFECGMGLIQLGALRQALDLFTRAERNHPQAARVWFGLGIAEYLLGRRQDAVSALVRSADADADFFPPLQQLAQLSDLTDPAEADVRRRIAGYLVAHPDDAEAHFAYALALRSQARAKAGAASQQEVVWQLKRALQLNPGIAQAFFQLGEIDAEAGNVTAAIEDFARGLKLEPGNARAHYRLSLLYRRSGQRKNARREMNAFLALRKKTGDEKLSSSAANVSGIAGSDLLVPVQRDCGSNPE